MRKSCSDSSIRNGGNVTATMRGRCAAPAFACEKSENAAVEAIQRSLLSFFS